MAWLRLGNTIPPSSAACLLLQLAGDGVVVLVDHLHEDEQAAHRQDRDPRPGEELRHHYDDQHRPGADETDSVDHPRAHHRAPHGGVGFGAQQPRPVPDHADLAQRERHEHPDDVELDQRGDLGAEGDDERDRGESQEQDAVGERQPVTAGVQLPRQETVLGQNRSQHREAVERRVGRQHQDQRGDTRDEEQPERKVVEDRRRPTARSRSSAGSRAARRPVARVAAPRSGRRSALASMIMPMNKRTAIRPSSADVVAALRDLGFRNAGTPLLIASTPVSAARARRERPRDQENQREPEHVAVLGVHLETGRLGAQRFAEQVDLEEPPGQHGDTCRS